MARGLIHLGRIDETTHGGHDRLPSTHNSTDAMLSWSITFLVIALIAAVFGFGGIAASAAGIAKILFFIFLILFVVSLVMGKTKVQA